MSPNHEAGCPVFVHTFGESRQPKTSEHALETFVQGYSEEKGEGFRFRWFHVPLNDTERAKECLLAVQPTNTERDEQAWDWKLRPALSSIQPPSHAIHMEPSCDHSEPQTPKKWPLSTLYLPFMVYDTYSNYKGQRTHYYPHNYETNNPREPQNRLHPRRTLDQFFYPSIYNTADRDADQTLSKWTGNDLDRDGRRRAEDDSLLILIDQLWCWVLDDYTIISFFPSNRPEPGSELESYKFRDLYMSIRSSMDSCDSVWDLYALLFKEASTYLLASENRRSVDLLETYRWVNNKKAANQIECFQRFQSSELYQARSSDDQDELNLFLEVADIIDELKMIRHLVQQQRAVLNALIGVLRSWHVDANAPKEYGGQVQFFNNRLSGGSAVKIEVFSSRNDLEFLENTKLSASRVAGVAKSYVIYTEETLMRLAINLEAIQNDAEYTQKLLLGLLDLKQKTASLAEARSTTKQGGAIMLFTIVTVIFLPLSFFTSFFGQNVSEITGDDQNPTTWELWKLASTIFENPLSLSQANYITNN
ncbi:hypothetical protein O1611_g5601 [Lasiodiplodia mahajangana]|uniref:Uncharacterized protein n=1 Tax=Lasiodiplodia mahajangana TaxID=1108764 RepID=A0ACC2JKT5_9PEZI|nr:hypothetical protein O1611_g5601 [Lasiodiplodia mahajangana]